MPTLLTPNASSISSSYASSAVFRSISPSSQPSTDTWFNPLSPSKSARIIRVSSRIARTYQHLQQKDKEKSNKSCSGCHMTFRVSSVSDHQRFRLRAFFLHPWDSERSELCCLHPLPFRLLTYCCGIRIVSIFGVGTHSYTLFDVGSSKRKN